MGVTRVLEDRPWTRAENTAVICGVEASQACTPQERFHVIKEGFRDALQHRSVADIEEQARVLRVCPSSYDLISVLVLALGG